MSTASERPATGSPAERFRSADPANYPPPSSREEEWRFSPLPRLRDFFSGDPSDERLSVETSMPEGVEIVEIGPDDPALAELPVPSDLLGALARRNRGGALLIRIAKAAIPGEPVIVGLRGTGSENVVWEQVIIEAGEQSETDVVLEYSGSARYAAQTSVLIGDGARLNLVQVQDWAPDTVHADQVSIRVGRDASARHTAITLGGGVVRMVPTVEFAGPGGSAQLLGVGYAGQGQHLESRLFVDHSVPECSSDVMYKNVLSGEHARTVWIGDVRIRPSALATQTYELNRNLLLSDGARADSVPNLEIETGEIVGAGHASATGRFDDLQLFYLQSRGISEHEARRLVVRGFLADVINRIGIPELQDRLLGAVDVRLGAIGLENPADTDPDPTDPDPAAAGMASIDLERTE